MREFVKVFKSLSDETRLRILNILMERECCVCEVMQALDISQTRASRNLSALYEAGFLKIRRNGLWVLYSIDENNLKKSYRYLLREIQTEMDSNPTGKQDRERLKTAIRTGVSCHSALTN